MEGGPERSTTLRTGDVRWRLRIRPGVHEEVITRSRGFLSWCDELAGVRLACPRCGRRKAVVRRWRPVGCQTVYWLLCLSVVDRQCNFLSQEVLRELLTVAVGPLEACALLGEHTGPGPTG